MIADLIHKAIDALSFIMQKAIWVLIVGCYVLMALTMLISMGGIIFGVLFK